LQLNICPLDRVQWSKGTCDFQVCLFIEGRLAYKPGEMHSRCSMYRGDLNGGYRLRVHNQLVWA